MHRTSFDSLFNPDDYDELWRTLNNAKPRQQAVFRTMENECIMRVSILEITFANRRTRMHDYIDWLENRRIVSNQTETGFVII